MQRSSTKLNNYIYFYSEIIFNIFSSNITFYCFLWYLYLLAFISELF